MKRSRFNQLLRDHLRHNKGGFLLAALCTVAISVTELLGPWPLKIIFDHILLNREVPDFLGFLDELLQTDANLALVLSALAIVLIAVVQGVLSYTQQTITSRIGSRAVFALRNELFSHLQRLSLSFHNRARSGELMTKVASDTKTLQDIFAESILRFGTQLLSFVGMFVVMFLLDWQLTMVTIATFPFLAFIYFHLYRKTKVSGRRRRKQEGNIASQMSEVLGSVPLVQAFGREKYEEQQFKVKTAVTMQETIRQARLEAVAKRSTEIISSLGKAITILVGSWGVLKGSMTPGELLVFVSYVNAIYKPIRGSARLSATLSKAVVSAERISDILEVEPEIQDSPDAIEATDLRGEITFDHVSFCYDDGKPVLNDISFVVSPGQRVAIVGASGAGKSTILGLLLRFYDPQAGSIYLNGVNLKSYQRESLRRGTGIVLQSSLLFGATIKENIAYGKLDATDEEIIAAAKAANAHGFISQLARGYDTVIGERGSTLSGGQAQRINIARAIIRNADILILDEVTSGLDKENERDVLDALMHLAAGRTTFFISHDLQLASQADLILYVEEGRVIELGTHEELIRKGGRYASLYRLQSVNRKLIPDEKSDAVSARS